METVSSAEIVEILTNLTFGIDSVFQSWVALTFALIVAGYLVGPKLPTSLKVVITALYLMSTFALLRKFNVTASNMGMFSAELMAREFEWQRFGPSVTYSRLFVMLGGTIAAIWFLFRGDKFDDAD